MASNAGPSSPNKRKSSEPLQQSHNGKKRTRVSYSCSECHRRKQKCDRQVPCGHCVARKVPELCHAYQPGKSEGDLHLRLARVERILEIALPDLAGCDTPTHGDDTSSHLDRFRRSPSTSPDEDAQESETNPAGGTLTSGRWFGNSALGSVTSQNILESLNQGEMTQVVEQTPSLGDRLKTLVQDYGVAPHKLSELVTELPPRRHCDILVDYYFKQINWTRYPIYEQGFRISYDVMWGNGVNVQPGDVRFLPLLFVVLAISVRLAPEHIGGDDRTRRLSSLRYYWSSRRSLLIASALGEGMELVLTRLLGSRFLIFDRRITESWNALGTATRAAQALGMHRDGAKLGLDSFQTEYRRRVWSYLYHADQTHALLLGRPPSIIEHYTDTLPPSNVQDVALLANPTAPLVPQPLSQPTKITYGILRNQLAVVVGHIVHHFQGVRGHHYSEVLQLDEELQRFVANLPPHYSMDPDTSLDNVLDFIPVHRYLIITEVFFVRISLHRPYMLRRLNSDRFEPSRKACLESAKQDFQIRQMCKRTMPPEVQAAMGGAYREFQAAMISGISLVIDPHGPDREIMHDILDAFIKDHANLTDMDETTRREIKIIELLKNKASAITENGRHPTNHQDGSDTKHPRERVSDVRTAVMDGANDTHMYDDGRSGGQLVTADFSKQLDPSYLPRVLPSASHHSNSPHSPVIQTQSPSFPPANPHISRSPHLYSHQSRGSISSALDGSSPSTEEESAQRLLDNWIHSANTVDGHFDTGSNGMWNPMMTLDGTNIPSAFGPAVENTAPMDGSDWRYWETLVEHIRSAGI